MLQIEQTDTSGKTSRHDTGSHYTPRPIVHYLCRDGLRIWLEQAPPDAARAKDWPDRLQKLLAIDASDGVDPEEMAVLESCLTPEEARVLLERLDNLRACDPAVGSGAFPVGLLYELVNLARLCETRLRGKDPVADDPEWLFSTKSRFIQRVIYGVDIQERAVEICKLRLWLSLIVDHPLDVDVDKCSAKEFRHALKRLPALPNLDFKIRVANSLIDRVHGEPVNLAALAPEDRTLPPILNKLTGAKRQFYEAHSITDKRRLRFDILDATAELAMVELARSKLDFGLLVDESDQAAMTRLAELDRAQKEMGAVREQIAAARRPKTKASEQDQTLERLTERFNDPKKPTFVWQLDFAEVFHRFIGARNGDLAPDEAKAAQPTAKAGAGQHGGFDLVVGNPPYIRIQVLKDAAPGDAAYFKDHYDSAGKGNYDIYVVFVERSLQLMNPKGVLAFILPHKFFNAHYGEPLRAQLAKGRHLSHVVHFGDQQIFPGATNYVCLLFLAKEGADACRWVRADNLPDWLNTFRAPEATLPATRFTPAEWNFAVGIGAGLFEKLQKLPIKLGDVAHLFVGVQTDADDVFIVEVVSEKKGKLVAYSKSTDREHEFEASHLKPFLKGSLNVRRYALSDLTKRLIFPYETHGGASRLIPAKDYERRFPLTWSYLKACRERLSERAGGEFSDYWHGYVYKKNHTRFEQPKLVVPAIGMKTCFAADFEGSYYFVGSGGGGGGGYGIVPDSAKGFELSYLLGLLNSSVSTYLLRRISTPFRGGYFALTRQFIEQLPVHRLDLEKASERAEHDALVRLVERILTAKRAAPDADTTALEREIDERVYRLYGLTADEIKLVEETRGA
ncbi:MAG: Eco57I restriction-modification methylase domain-containing protein [Verrucomicrobia bacterium]|nr:Eco57I restriction-modification methylase domain-containing protein [Verrucomicrobiota bacterium]